MKAKIFVLIPLFIFTLIQCNSSQYINNPRLNNNFSYENNKFKDGKCYAKCLIPDQIELYSQEYPIYTGNELEENVKVIIKEIEIEPKTTKWVKKKADKNCISNNPNDCLVWCLIEVPAITKELKILVDTTQSLNYELQSIDYKHIVSKGGFMEWKEVLCKKNISKQIIGQIQNSLKENGYFRGTESFELDRKTKNSLAKFQEDNKLPIGHLDYETLDILGIVIK